ncbi:MAG: erythromycin esterase family protein [Actinomycetota bacterium]|nr:erythromycin esterase family protein [Actinomycetota bacterium]
MTEGVLTALRRRSLELRSLHPGGAHGDLARWGERLGGVRVVGLGEATHGSREFFTLKHRLIEYLVTQQGFTVFALEADRDRCGALDAYVTTGEGDAVQGLRDVGYWTWNTQEVLALLIWLRGHNATVSAGRAVRVVGVDPSDRRRRGVAGRDRAMAQAVLGSGERKVVFWGHNGHISARYVTGRLKATGGYLRDELGPAYYALGLTFHHGSFQALRVTRRGLRGPEEFAVGMPPRRSLERTLAAIGHGDQLVDLRGGLQDADLGGWAGRRQRMRSFGSIALPLVSDQLASVVPAQDFDGIAFARCTTRARPLGAVAGRD